MPHKVEGRNKVVSEGEVLVATIRFLFGIGATPTHISVPHGQGIDTQSIKEEVERVFRDEPRKSVKPEFVGSGPDVEAVSDDLYWKIECKGYGTGKPSTQRTSFDRALASVVSYYEDRRPVALGLALPASEEYLHLLRTRVGKSLRTRLNLWVLLYHQGEIKPINPYEYYPW